jgi:hypothetical protein
MNYLCKLAFILSSLIFSQTSLSASQPENSWLGSSGDWYCDDGYKKVGDTCEAIDIPENSYAFGSEWYCESGYVRFQGKCALKRLINFAGSDTPQPGSISSSLKDFSTPTLNSNSIVPSFKEPSNGTGQSVIRSCAENGSCYGDISAGTGRPKTVPVRGYYRKDGTYVRGYYRSKPR